jgi:hypothetical protein
MYIFTFFSVSTSDSRVVLSNQWKINFESFYSHRNLRFCEENFQCYFWWNFVFYLGMKTFWNLSYSTTEIFHKIILGISLRY